MLYTNTDRQTLNAQIIRRAIVTALLFLIPFAAGLAVMYTIRLQWLSLALSLAGMAAAVFHYGMCVSPFLSYHKYLRDVMAGRSHRFCGRLLREESASLRDGVKCRTLYFSNSEKEDEERLCYLDLEKPFDFAKDREYMLTTHGQSIIAIEEK